jgi:hypothetical protein
MTSQVPETAPKENGTIHPLCILRKAFFLFVIFNLVLALWDPPIGKLSAYNRVYPGLERFPYGQIPELGFHFSLSNLDALFASHIISGGLKPSNEFRVLVIGDSAIWGYLLQPKDTLSGALNKRDLTTCDGRNIKFYNLGFPGISDVKDLFFLIYAQRYQPDMVVWVVTMLSFPQEQQEIPVVQNNWGRMLQRFSSEDLPANPFAIPYQQRGLWQRTIIGQRVDLMDMLSLHLYGIFWSLTGLDQVFPSQYPSPQVDFKRGDGFYDWNPPVLTSDELSFDVIEAGMKIAGDDPVILVNEPIFISSGENSDILYNKYYPRWAFDLYRQMLQEKSNAEGWNYLDLWNLLPADVFTNTEFHLSPTGENIMAQQIVPLVLSQSCP